MTSSYSPVVFHIAHHLAVGRHQAYLDALRTAKVDIRLILATSISRMTDLYREGLAAGEEVILVIAPAEVSGHCGRAMMAVGMDQVRLVAPFAASRLPSMLLQSRQFHEAHRRRPSGPGATSALPIPAQATTTAGTPSARRKLSTPSSPAQLVPASGFLGTGAPASDYPYWQHPV